VKTLYLLIIAILIFSTLLYLKPIQADNANGVEIQNIQTQPSAIIIGYTFKINATLVNNSSNPIFVEHGSCEAPFSVTFDNHVTVNVNNINCTTEVILQKLNPGEKITTTSPGLDVVYRATEAGTVNATVTFAYEIWNQNTQSNSNEIISEPFSFTIYDKTKVPTLSPSANQELIGVATAIPGLQNWSHDWQYVSMGFMTAKNQPGNWQYAIVNLKASSNSSLIPCDNGWDAMVTIDRTTMKVISASYPTMEYHNCDNYATGGGPGLSDILPKIESPLKQFKSGVTANNVTCNQGLELIFKEEDDSPACVKSNTAPKLTERGWALTRLTITGLKETYGVGEKIGFIIDFQGLLHYCNYPQVSVLDSNQNAVWKSQDINSMCVTDLSNPLPYVNQNFDLNSGYGGPIMINKTGNYTMKVSLEGNSVEKGFTVK
jgi:hypothetical protein